MLSLDAHIEAILFWKGEPVSLKRLADIVKKEPKEVEDALLVLEGRLKDRGLALVYKDKEVMLGTSPAASATIEELAKDELVRDLGKAGLETLSIIIYQGPIARGEIDYIRGVYSNFILRNLLVRGLVERIPSQKDARSFLYRPTFGLLQHLGIRRVEDAPEYGKVRTEIESFKERQEETAHGNPA